MRTAMSVIGPCVAMCTTTVVSADILTVQSASLLAEHSISFTPDGGGAPLTGAASSSSSGWLFGDPNLNLTPGSDTISDGITSWTAGSGGVISGSGTSDSGEIAFGTTFTDTLNNPTGRPDSDFQGSVRSRFELTFSVSEETRLHFQDGIWFTSFTLSTVAGDISVPYGATLVSGAGTATLDFDSSIVRPGESGILITSGTYTLVADWTIGPTAWQGWPVGGGVGFSMSWAGNGSVPGPAALASLLGAGLCRRRRR